MSARHAEIFDLISPELCQRRDSELSLRRPQDRREETHTESGRVRRKILLLLFLLLSSKMKSRDPETGRCVGSLIEVQQVFLWEFFDSIVLEEDKGSRGSPRWTVRFPGSSCLHVEGSLSENLNPELLLSSSLSLKGGGWVKCRTQTSYMYAMTKKSQQYLLQRHYSLSSC